MSTFSRLAMAVIAALFIAACQPGGAVPSGSPTTDPTPRATPKPSPTPDVAALFSAAYGSVKSGVLTMTGSLRIGDVQLTISGQDTFNGPDHEDSILTSVAGVSTTTRHVRVAGARYAKNGIGPWLEDSSSASGADFGAELGRLAASVTDAGLEIRNGEKLHKLVPATGTKLDPTALGFGAADSTAEEGSVVFYATADGTPVALLLDASWTQPSGESTIDATLSLEVGFSDLGTRQTIRVPDHVWTVHASEQFAYQVAYPDTWDATGDTEVDIFVGPGESFAGIVRVELPDGMTLNILAKSEADTLREAYAAVEVTNDEYMLGGEKARLLKARGTDAGQPVVAYEALAIHGADVYSVSWYSPADHEAADLATFEAMLASFAFM